MHFAGPREFVSFAAVWLIHRPFDRAIELLDAYELRVRSKCNEWLKDPSFNVIDVYLRLVTYSLFLTLSNFTILNFKYY